MKSLSEGLIESGLSTLDGMRLNMLSIDGISLSFPRVVCEGFLISLLLGAVLIPLIIDNFAGGSGIGITTQPAIISISSTSGLK